jgi:hypothetical protein
MIRFFTVLLALAAVAAADKKLALTDLPPAVRKTVQEQANGAEIKNIGKETEHGVTQYEVETMRNGKHRDFNVDTKGNLIEVEEETTLDAVPAAVRVAIEKKVADGKLTMGETVTKGSQTFYEASYTGKNGRKHEALFTPAGAETKD